LFINFPNPKQSLVAEHQDKNTLKCPDNLCLGRHGLAAAGGERGEHLY
jgi:hypothetical protein